MADQSLKKKQSLNSLKGKIHIIAFSLIKYLRIVVTLYYHAQHRAIL